jgi:single-stranded DNA-binding protein
MLTLTGNGHLTRDVELRSTRNRKSVATVHVASDRRDRQAEPLYVDLILWEGQAEAAAEHLVNGQAVAFSGHFEPRQYTTRDGVACSDSR